MHCFFLLHWVKVGSSHFRQVLFQFGAKGDNKKEQLLVVIDRWLSYTGTTVWKLAWADSTLVILDEWTSYRGGNLSRFDCS